MRRMKISKFKQVFTLAFIPRVCKGDFRYSPGKFVKLSLGVRKSACRSTSSCSQTENETKKCQQIIDRVFAPNIPFTETIFTECNPKTESIAQIVSSQPLDKESRCELCKKLIKHIFGDGGETSSENAAGVVKPHESPQAETVNATTAKIHEEQLAQKVEVIDETPLVEAHKPKVEGFNLQPKVLGGKEKEEGEGEREVVILNFSKDKYFDDLAERSANERAAERAMKREKNFDVLVGSIDNKQDIVKLNFSTNKNFNDHAEGSVKKGETNYDELAKRCLDSPSGQIDERLLKEMGKLGVPPTSGRDSKKSLNEHEFIQAEIMKKRRKPSEKTDLDLLAIDNKDFAKFNRKIPRISHGKSIRNSMIACQGKSSKKITHTYRHLSSNELGYMATTGISGDETMKSSSEDSKTLNNKPDIKEINVVDHVSVTIEESAPKFEQLPAKETTPNLETLKESRNKDIIQNLIRTRVEHLIHDSIKSVKMEEDNYNIISKTNVQFDDKNQTYVVKSTGSESEISSNISKEPIKTNNEEIIGERLTEETMDGESKKSVEFANRGNSEGILNTSGSDPLQDVDINFFKHERVTPTHILSKQDMDSDESSSLPHPGVIIREFMEMTVTPTPQEDFQSPSIPKNTERVTPTHILFKQDINSDESSSLPHPGVIVREFVEMTVPHSSKEDSQSPSLPKTTAKSNEGMLQEVHTHEDNICKHDKSALYSKQYNMKQYLMKVEPTVYKSNIYRKYVEYLQKARKPIENRSDIYSPHQPTEEPKPIKVESTEDRNNLNAQYVNFVIQDNKPAEKEPVVDRNTFSEPYNYVQSSQQSRIDGEQKEEQPAVDQSGKYNLQQQQPMEMQPTPTQNYAYNQYTNYMHSVQQPPMDNQYSMPQDNIYNPYNYFPNQTQEVPSVDNQNIDHMQSVTSKSVEGNVTPEIEKEKDLDHKIEPVIVAETGRNPPPEKTKPSATVKDPLGNSCILSENLERPLIGQESLAHITRESIQQYPSEQLTPISTETMSLSQLLKKVRERNRMEYCRDTILRMKSATQIEPIEGKCGTKPPACPPPAPTCPPPKPQCPPPPPPDCPPCPQPPKPPCPPPKPPCPNPCKPKCPPPCKPNPCAPKPQCPPVKKSPCEKFKKCNCSLLQIEDALALLVYYGPQFYIPENVILPKITGIIKNKTKIGISKRKKDCNISFSTMDQVTDVKIDSVMYARTYHPWSPIPSWPVPKKQDKKKLVCPKDGCKQNPPSLNPPCNDINPCLTFPKPNSLSKRSFSIVDYLYLMLTLNLAS